jgi:peptidoglycan/LPS O-acetylase OafA/YrhL
VALATVIAVTGLAAVLASLWLIDDSTPFPGPWTLLPTVGALLLLLAGTQAANPVSQALGWRPIVAIGDTSYSLYLWHWPVIVFAAALWPETAWVLVVAAVLSIVPAVLSYRYVEQPIRLSRGHPAILVAATIIPPLALAGGLWWASANGMWSPRVQAYKEVVQSEGIAVQRGCDLGIPVPTARGTRTRPARPSSCSATPTQRTSARPSSPPAMSSTDR